MKNKKIALDIFKASAYIIHTLKQWRTDMNFRDARDLAIEFGCKVPKFNHTAAIAQCWIDRIELLLMKVNNPVYTSEQIEKAIKEANRYAG
jgi:hypothetical protein